MVAQLEGRGIGLQVGLLGQVGLLIVVNIDSAPDRWPSSLSCLAYVVTIGFRRNLKLQHVSVMPDLIAHSDYEI